jgi:hypothetical protein
VVLALAYVTVPKLLKGRLAQNIGYHSTSNTNAEMDLKIDFTNDLGKILQQKLLDSGYSIKPNQTTDSICIQYFNTLKRRIKPRPRKVLMTKEFKCPVEYTEGINIITQKVETAQDLTPHLNKIHNPSDSDSLLNDWGIYHFHLGTLLERSGFVNRTGPLLFARVTDDFFYMLDVLGHNNWYQQRLIELIHENWKSSLDMYRLPEGYRSSFSPITDQEVEIFRKANINTFIQVSDGTTYVPPGGGQAINGISSDVRVTCNIYLGTVRNFEKYVKDNLANYRDIARQNGLELPQQTHFQLQLVDGEAFAVELTVGIAYRLCEMPLQISVGL